MNTKEIQELVTKKIDSGERFSVLRNQHGELFVLYEEGDKTMIASNDPLFVTQTLGLLITDGSMWRSEKAILGRDEGKWALSVIEAWGEFDRLHGKKRSEA